MAERFNVRNVAQKEIYDSYMGILRISPNDGVDDPTELLTDLEGKGVVLSDSNGTMLPISFSPKAFMRKVYDGSEKPIINITTTAQNTTYVSNTLTVRSTLLLKKNAGIQDKTSALVIGSSSSNDSKYSTSPKSILHYPIEAPNDKKYFNDGNEYQLFKKETHPLTHYEQVKQALNKKDQNWYNTNSEIHDHQVKVNGEYIFTHNDDGDQIPILHSRDYVLGSYDGHSWKNTSDSDSKAVKFNDNISDANSPFNAINSFNDVTKMSWLRIDDIIWQALEQVLAGDARHFNGRYTNLGNATSKIENGAAQDVENNQTSIIDKLFDTKNTKPNETEQVRKYAPILGQGVQNGLIMYHAMPFHRYWFHRCRQAKANIIRKYKYKEDSPIKTDSQEYELYNSSDDVITKSSMASVTPVHSLVKDFLLCNGNVVNFKNFPNINPSNANLFNIPDEDFGKPTDTFQDIDFGSSNSNDTKKSIHEAMFHSKITDAFGRNPSDNHIVLPNLFSLKDKSPRFIRGMDFINHFEKNRFTFDLQKTHRLYYYSKNFLENEELKAPLKDDFGNYGNAYEKFYTGGTTPKDAVELHFYNYDFLTPTTTHTHQLFSNHQGGIGLTNDYTKCYYYDTNQNDGGNLHKRWALKNTINRNLLFNNVSYPSTKWLSPSQKVEIGSTRKSLFGQSNTSTSQNSKTKKVKGWDEVGWVLQQSKLWLDYCLGQHTKQLFKNFTPIPNVGLFLFNGDLFNQKSRQYNLQYNVPKDQSYQLIYTWQTKPFTDSTNGTNSTDSTNKTLIPQMTISNVTDAKLEDKNVTGYSSSIVAAHITSNVVKKIKQEWKAKNKIYSAVKTCFTKKISSIIYYAMEINDTYDKITEVHCDSKGKKYVFFINNGDNIWKIDETVYEKVETTTTEGEKKYHYQDKDKNKIEEKSTDYEIFNNLEVCQLKFTDNLVQTYKFNFSYKIKDTTTNKDTTTYLYNDITKVDTTTDDDKKNRRNYAWNTYMYFMQHPLPTKTLSTSTIKKKASLAEIETYVNSYDTKLLSFSGSADALYGDDRGTISVLQEGDNPWQGYCYYDAQGGKHLIQKLGGYGLTEADKYDKNKLNQEITNKLDNEIKNKLTLYNEQKMKRRMLAMKINESQACIPISYYGKAQFSTRYLYTYERKRSSGSSAGKGDEWDTEQQNFTIKDVGNYIIGMYYNSNNHQGQGAYRCVTSLAYTNPEYLGFGDITQPYDPQKPQTYWNVNNVTDFYKSQKSKTAEQMYRTTYGDSQFIEVDTKSPYPTHIKLLPLIRL